jgi:hypothetical protein
VALHRRNLCGVSFNVNHMLGDANKWQQVSGQSLYIQMQTGLAQIYWQWQQAGRPQQIDYQPENADKISQIIIDKQGRPQIAQNEKGCEQMLSWFVDQKALNYRVKVSIKHNAGIILVNQDFVCRFEYAKYVYLYNTRTRQLDFAHAG